jgi:hypothetical protein
LVVLPKFKLKKKCEAKTKQIKHSVFKIVFINCKLLPTLFRKANFKSKKKIYHKIFNLTLNLYFDLFLIINNNKFFIELFKNFFSFFFCLNILILQK